MIATPEVRLDGPRKAYKKVQTALLRMKGVPRIGLQNVTVVDTDEPLVNLLRRALRIAPGSHGRLTKSTFNGHFIEDAYVYRLI